MLKISVTGASGHIGNNLCRELISRGFKVKVLINKSEFSLSGLAVEKVYGSITDPKIVDKLIEGADYVYHAAAIITIGNESLKEVMNVNIEGTRNVVKACKKYSIRRLIHFSSIHALHCNNHNTMLDESFPLASEKDLSYDRSKAAGEQIVLDACKYGLNALILNPSSVIGPNDFVPSLIGQMQIKIAKGNLPFLIPGGYHFVDVRDVVATAIHAMEKGRSGERYLISGQWWSLDAIASLISKECKRKKPRIIPKFLAWVGLPFILLYSRINGIKPLYTRESLTIIANSPKAVNLSKAAQELDLKPRSVEKSFTDAIKWYIENKYI